MQEKAGNAKPVEEMSFEEAIAELEAIVQRLEAGELTLEESVRCFERGTELARRCEALLEEAEQRIRRLEEGTSAREDEAPF
ncbi:MAG: exodeoxyribonuclease VII small subunit [Zetaproteobacteria bacterium]|nr:MAG: exodeoxyribonuclease VII small subunit [Zetaproteobacteria bacterium]